MIDQYPGIYATQQGLLEALKDPKHALWVNAAVLPETARQFTRIHTLNLVGKMSALPGWIGELTTLRHLRLDGNNFTTLPREIGKLTRMAWIGLTQNSISSLPEEIGALTALDSLWLDHNPKLKELPSSLFSLPKLRRLDLTNTGIKSLPESITGLVSLQQLALEKTPLFKDKKARAAVQALFPGSIWSEATLVIPRKAPMVAPLSMAKKKVVELIQTEQLADRAVIADADLSKATFSSIALKGQHLHKANLRGSRWSKCALSISLTGADLRDAVFEDCLIEGDLSTLSMKNADLRGAVFRRCVLVNVAFDQADLRGARFELAPVTYGPHFKEVKGEGVTLISDRAERMIFDRADLTRATLAGTFKFATFEGATLTDADLSKADLQDSSLQTQPEQVAAPPKTVVSTPTIGCVSSEGGPLMVADLGQLSGWGGSDIRQGEREDDYSKLIDGLGDKVVIIDQRAIWPIFPGSYSVSINAARDEVLLFDGDAPPRLKPSKSTMQISVSSGRMVVLWAPITHQEIAKRASKWKVGQPSKELAASGWALGIECTPGAYQVSGGERWCRLKLK